ncbi:MAG TPA: hypothetical protein PKA88_22225 [Polyangiaceae bacterium]|nr:hypothetical protein [Polyangiaceae bacterium]HMR75087.1 hypothetical protein [Polyangiaceae bacterium]
MTPPRPFPPSTHRSDLVPATRLARRSADGFQEAAPYAMGSYTRRVFRAIIRCLMPPPPAPSSDAILDEVESVVRNWMPYMLPISARGLWLSILILDFAPLFLFVAPSRLHRLPQAQASTLLSEMVHGRFAFLRLLVVAMRGVVLSAYFDQDEVHRAIGYRPVAFMRDRIALRDELLSPKPPRHSLQPPLPKQTGSIPPPALGTAS